MNVLRFLLVFLFLLPCMITGCSAFFMSGAGDDMFIEVESGAGVAMDEATAQESEILYHYLTGELAYLDEDFDDALSRFSRASELASNVVPPLHEKLAELYVRSGALEEALNESGKLLESEPDNVEYRMLHASILESNGRFADAATYYSGILKDDKHRNDVVILLANVYIREGKFDQAEAVLRAVDKSGRADILILFNLGRVAELRKDKRKALKYYRRAFDREPRSPLVVGDILRLQLEVGEYEAAEKYCKEVIELQPENALARKVLSHLLLGDKKIDEALQQFEALESMDQQVGEETRLKIALIYMDKQNFKEAMRQLLLILAEEPKHDEARFYLASIYAGANRVRDALSELEKVEVGQKMYIKSLTFAAFLWRQEGNLEKAQEAILKAYRAEPDNLRVIYYTIVILRDNEKTARAEDVLEEALALYPDNEKFRFQYAVLLHDRDAIDESVENMEKLIASNPDHSDALNFVAYTLAERKTELEKATRYAERALKVKPDEPYYLDTLGWVYYQKGDFKTAEKYLRKSIDLVRTDPVMLEHYGDVLIALERDEEALEYYKKALDNLPKEMTEEDTETYERIKTKLEALEETQTLLVPSTPGRVL